MKLVRHLIVPVILALIPLATADAQTDRAPIPAAPPGQAPTTDQLDQLTAPIALYPDSLVAQILLCSQSPYQVRQVDTWLSQNQDLHGTELQDAAQSQGFDQSFVALSLFPDVIHMMAADITWTTNLGNAFSTNKDAVFDSIQRLRAKAKELGNLESNDQQTVVVQAASSGQKIIVIQPANPQIIYVPTYNPQVVYVQSAPVYVSSPGYSAGTVAAAGVIGFAAGVVVGAAINDDWCGGWGWHGGCCYSGGWNNYYQHQENMWKTYQKQQTKRTEIRQENWTERQGNRQQGMTDRTQIRNDNNWNQNRPTPYGSNNNVQVNNNFNRQNVNASNNTNFGNRAQPGDYGTRGRTPEGYQPSQTRLGGDTSAFGGYQNGNAERAASSRGNRSMSSSGFSGGANRSGGGANRSGGGGGRRGR